MIKKVNQILNQSRTRVLLSFRSYRGVTTNRTTVRLKLKRDHIKDDVKKYQSIGEFWRKNNTKNTDPYRRHRRVNV